MSLGRNIIDLHTEHKGHLPRHFGMEVVQAENARPPCQTKRGLIIVEKGDTLLEKWVPRASLVGFLARHPIKAPSWRVLLVPGPTSHGVLSKRHRPPTSRTPFQTQVSDSSLLLKNVTWTHVG
jgi:hypothetical protein